MRLQGVRDMLEVTEGHNVLAHFRLDAVLRADLVTGGFKDDAASASDPHLFCHALDAALAIQIVLVGLLLPISVPPRQHDLFALLES